MSVTTPKLSNTWSGFRLGSIKRNVRQQPPFILWLSASLVVALAMLPFGYLIIRASGAGYEKVLNILMRPRTHQIFLNSAGLAFSVTLAAAVSAKAIPAHLW